MQIKDLAIGTIIAPLGLEPGKITAHREDGFIEYTGINTGLQLPSIYSNALVEYNEEDGIYDVQDFNL